VSRDDGPGFMLFDVAGAKAPDVDRLPPGAF
jgi:hypothetical protein